MSEAAGARVLVVDDNEQNCALVEMTLEAEGLEVAVAHSGEEGLRVFGDVHPDCVLLDVRMPDLDGTSVCRRMKSSDTGADTPILFLTAMRDIETFDRAIEAGGDDFLTKPIQPPELVVRVLSALKMRRLGAELRDQFELVRHQRDALMRLQLQKERLSAFIIHDLKNPVNAIDLHAQFMLRTRGLPETTRDSARRIRGEVRSLMRLIFNLLDLGKAEEGQLAPSAGSVDLGALVHEVLDALAVNARDARVTLRSEVLATRCHADADLLRRILENLVDNALRYAPRGTAVTLTTKKTDDGGVELRVRDAGRGVPDDLKAKIFERFVQVETAGHAERESRGLGLAFCKHAVEAHGGQIWVEDGTPGSVFCVRLPHGS